VKPEHRGKGYGEALMKAVLSYAEAKIITLCTGLGNVSFFRRYGFEVTEIGDSLVSMERKL
jgi:predicted N-acetyltransferase YhbS